MLRGLPRSLHRFRPLLGRAGLLIALCACSCVVGTQAGATSASKHPVGSTQTLSSLTGTPYSVKLAEVLDPATPATRTFFGPKSGTRFVATEFTVTNKGHSSYTNDANGDTSVVGSNNQVYTVTFATVTECTNFANGVFDLAPSDSETGCVVFDLPDGVNAVRVIWASTSGFGNSIQWTITAPAPPAPTPPAPPPTHTFTTFTRIYGQTAVATAAEEVEHEYPPTSGSCVGVASTHSVILATDTHYPDALAGSYLAGVMKSGILLTSPTSLPATTITAIRTEGVTTIFVLGGPLAVSTFVMNELQTLPVYSCGGSAQVTSKVMTVTRLYGATQYTTAAKVATYVAAHPTDVGSLAFPGAYSGTDTQGGSGRYNDTSGNASTSAPGSGELPTAILATGMGFQDAMAAGALSYAEHLPILLTTPTNLSNQAAAAVDTLGVKQVIVMGGPFAVSDAVVSTLQSLGTSVLRIAGQSYTDTSVQLAKFETTAATGLGWAGTGRVTVARGNGFTDGLAGAEIPGAASEPLVLTQSPTVVGTTLANFLHVAGSTGIGGAKVSKFTILGGPFAVTQATINQMGTDL